RAADPPSAPRHHRARQVDRKCAQTIRGAGPADAPRIRRAVAALGRRDRARGWDESGGDEHGGRPGREVVAAVAPMSAKRAGRVGNPKLPVIGGGVARSKAATWRTGVLIAVHLLIALHLVHWLTNGTTITPVEPSEAAALG